MGDDTVAKLARSLGRYQSIVVGGLAFLVVFAVTMMGIMLWQATTIGRSSAQIEHVADESHDVLCALYLQNVRQNQDAYALLKESPAGLLDARGNIVIAADLIQRGIDGRKDTIDAMKEAGLTC